MLRAVTSAADLSIFTQIGLVIFVVTFTAIVVYALTRSTASVQSHAAMPIHDPNTVPAKQRSKPRV